MTEHRTTLLCFHFHTVNIIWMAPVALILIPYILAVLRVTNVCVRMRTCAFNKKISLHVLLLNACAQLLLRT